MHEVSWTVGTLPNRKALCFMALAVEEEAEIVEKDAENVSKLNH